MTHLALLAAAIVVASAVPFLPTGELVAGTLAWFGSSPRMAVAVFVVAWVASVVGDSILFLESRLVARPIKNRLAGRSVGGPRVRGLVDRIGRGPITAMVVARLVPGGRAPMIMTLAAANVPPRTFLLGDVIGCGIWAALYSLIGTLGAGLADDPRVAAGLAVIVAAVVGLVAARLGPIATRMTARRSEDPASNIVEDARR